MFQTLFMKKYVRNLTRILSPTPPFFYLGLKISLRTNVLIRRTGRQKPIQSQQKCLEEITLLR